MPQYTVGSSWECIQNTELDVHLIMALFIACLNGNPFKSPVKFFYAPLTGLGPAVFLPISYGTGYPVQLSQHTNNLSSSWSGSGFPCLDSTQDIRIFHRNSGSMSYFPVYFGSPVARVYKNEMNKFYWYLRTDGWYFGKVICFLTYERAKWAIEYYVQDYQRLWKSLPIINKCFLLGSASWWDFLLLFPRDAVIRLDLPSPGAHRERLS